MAQGTGRIGQGVRLERDSLSSSALQRRRGAPGKTQAKCLGFVERARGAAQKIAFTSRHPVGSRSTWGDAESWRGEGGGVPISVIELRSQSPPREYVENYLLDIFFTP